MTEICEIGYSLSELCPLFTVVVCNYYLDHSYEKPYYSQDEFSQDEFSQDVSVSEVNTEADATLIDIVRGYPHLYAKNLKDFKDKNIRERSWMEIASILKCSVEECQRRWLRLRDRFSKERRLWDTETRSGSGSVTGRKEFSLYENMMFLAEHIQSRKTYTNLQIAKQKSIINACPAPPISSSIETLQNPSSPTLISLSPSMSPSSSESMPFSSASSASSRNTPSPQIQNCQQSAVPHNISKNVRRNSALLPPHNSTQSPHNLSIPVTSLQPLLIPQSSSDSEKSKSSEESSQINILKLKGRPEEMQQQNNFFNQRWTKRKRSTDTIETNFLKVSSEISSYIRNSQDATSNAGDVESFGKWIACELGKLSQIDKKQKMEKITQIIFS